MDENEKELSNDIQNIILALDIGSSSLRCSAYAITSKGGSVQAISKASSSIRVTSVQPNTGKIQLYFGKEEGGNRKTLMDMVDECLDATLIKLRENYSTNVQVVAVGISSFVMNLIAIDRGGRLVGEEATISYACNTREVANECFEIKQELGSLGCAELYQKTGAPIHSSYALPQLRALYKENSNTTQKIEKWQSIASLCISRWVGTTSLPISFSEGSWTGLLNFKTCTYEESALELLPLNHAFLPKLADITQPISIGLSPSSKYCTQWPELREASFFLGIGDGACANVGSKAVTESRIAVTIGTSAAARICLPLTINPKKEFQVSGGLFCYRIDKSHVLVGGALTDGGSVIEWAFRFLNLSSPCAFEECMKAIEVLIQEEYHKVDADSQKPYLTMIPFLSGERSTGYRAGATGSIMGLTRATKPAHLVKACLEGVTLRLGAILDRILETRQTRDPLPTILVSGKALESNPLWRQLIADRSGLRVVLDSETYEGTSRGVARLVAISRMAKDGDTSNLFLEEEIPANAETNDPRSNGKAYFDRAAVEQEELISAISPFYTRDG
jgi:gluconokinase